MTKTRVLLGAAAVAASLLVLVGGVPAEAAAQGFEPSTVTWYGNDCKAWINTTKINGEWNAQGLVHSWNGGDCQMDLVVSYHNGPWKQVSNDYEVINGQKNTGWHKDGPRYKAAVCVIDWNIATNAIYNCGFDGAV
ncbi:hypothetical protein ACWEQN_42590 [Streptomyces sp. NPDC004129]